MYRPMLAKAKKEIFDDPDWLFEPKLDGIRCIIYNSLSRTKLINRSMIDITDRFPEIKLTTTVSSIIDGELVCFDPETNIPDFQRMQTRMNRTKNIDEYANKYPAEFVAFDILAGGNKQLIDAPLIVRKEILSNVMGNCDKISYSLDYTIKNGTDLMNKLIGWEGVMAKRVDSIYQPGVRSPNWLKIKPMKIIEVLAVGCTKGIGKRADTFGALIIAQQINNKYRYMGEVGTGFTDEMLQEITEKIAVTQIKKNYYFPHFDFGFVRWFQPIPIRISYMEKTNDGKYRFPSFKEMV